MIEAASRLLSLCQQGQRTLRIDRLPTMSIFWCYRKTNFCGVDLRQPTHQLCPQFCQNFQPLIDCAVFMKLDKKGLFIPVDKGVLCCTGLESLGKIWMNNDKSANQNNVQQRMNKCFF
ncbi:MAG: hypothetical protein R2932_08280 [Caldilineaceae bacterium]